MLTTIKDADGNDVLANSFEGFDLRALFPTIIVVTPKKILGANYGFMVAPPFSTIRPERATLAAGRTGLGIQRHVCRAALSRVAYPAGRLRHRVWLLRADGRYEAGGSDNVGLGMWSHEIQFGTTVYLDAAKKISAATTAYFEMHSNKKDQDLKVGNLLTLEGGVAYNVPKIGGAFGVAYYLQNKLTDDSGADVPVLALRALNLYGQNKLFGIGPDVTMAVFQKGGTIGLVNFRYLWESAGRARSRAARSS